MDYHLIKERKHQCQVHLRKGFIVVSKYSEQQVGAAMIYYITLCKWAKYVEALPVEPIVSE